MRIYFRTISIPLMVLSGSIFAKYVDARLVFQDNPWICLIIFFVSAVIYRLSWD